MSTITLTGTSNADRILANEPVSMLCGPLGLSRSQTPVACIVSIVPKSPSNPIVESCIELCSTQLRSVNEHDGKPFILRNSTLHLHSAPLVSRSHHSSSLPKGRLRPYLSRPNDPDDALEYAYRTTRMQHTCTRVRCHLRSGHRGNVGHGTQGSHHRDGCLHICGSFPLKPQRSTGGAEFVHRRRLSVAEVPRTRLSSPDVSALRPAQLWRMDHLALARSWAAASCM